MAIGIRITRMIVLGEHATHDIFVDIEAKSVRDLLGDAHVTKSGIAALHFHDGRNQFGRWTFGARFAAWRGRRKE